MNARRGLPLLREAVEASMARLLDLERVSARRHWTPAAGTTVHALAVGEGAPLVLLHGGIGGGANWYRLLQRFPGHRVIAPDLPGFGLTPPVPLVPPLGRTAARILVAWLRAFGVAHADFVATSFGGLALLRLMQQAPALVRSATLVDSAGLGRGFAMPARAAALPLAGRLLTIPTRSGTRWTLRHLLTAGPGALPPSHEDALTEFMFSAARYSGAAPYAAALRNFASLRGQREVFTAEALQALPQPVLVVWGEADRLLPAGQARDLARRGTRVTLLPGVGHSPNWEAPEALAAAVAAFLEDPGRTSTASA